MAESPEFDLLNSPCEATTLVEASAGTGKTYAITGLFLRLMLEQNLLVNEILVVTFTEAATNELKDRIRRRLHDGLAAFSGGRIKDPFLAGLRHKHPDAAAAARRLRFAISSFDQASIFTIHGFCLRVLHEQAFESGMAFDAKLVSDQEDFVRELVHDFWRSRFYRASPLFLNHAFDRGFCPDSLRALVGRNLTNPYLKIIPQPGTVDCSRLEAAFQTRFDRVAQAWPSAGAEVEQLLTTSDALNRTRYRKESIPGWVEAMDAFFAGEGFESTLPDAFVKFTTEGVHAAVKKSGIAPSHPFFTLCDALHEAQRQLVEGFDQVLLGLQVEFVETVRGKLAKRKADRNTLFYDDLLLMLDRALNGPGGQALAAVVRNKYKAALIDEFQDTDAIQYAIFERIFGRGKSVLFLIGDPKQAIYGFRGADLFTYLEASRQASKRFTLGENWRSEPRLIDAVNAVFSHAEKPFVYDEIPFRPVKPAHDKQHDLLQVVGGPIAPLQVWLVESEKIAEGKPVTRTLIQELVPGAVAGEISRLLALSRTGQATLGNRPIQPRDLAVLVRRNAEAQLIQTALADLGVHAVLYNIGNLFDTEEALELARLLAAVADPSNAGLVRVAMATQMLGVNGEELDRLTRDEEAWEAWLIRFGDYHELWNRHGFFRMFRQLLSQEAVLPRLMSLSGGERRCTNILHLSEVLHQAAVDGNLSIFGLIKWYATQRNPATPRLEEHQLRLESDEDAVKIVTIHKSKGMEYPIVFCPFLGDGSTLRAKDGAFTFHDEAEGMRLTLDFGSSRKDEHARLAEKELLAENLRLLYVAMTRAQHRCTLVWGRLKDAGTSAPAYLFHQPREHSDNPVPNAVADRYAVLTDKDLWNDLKGLQRKEPGAIALLPMPPAAGRRQPVPDAKIPELGAASLERPPLRGVGWGVTVCEHEQDTPLAPLKGRMVQRDSTALAPDAAAPSLQGRTFMGRIDRAWRISSFSSLISDQPRMADWADRDEIAMTGASTPEGPREPPSPAGAVPDMFSFPRGTAAGIFLHELFEQLDFTERNPSVIQQLISSKLEAHGYESFWADPLGDMVRKVLEAPLEPGPGGLSLSRVAPAERLNELEFYFPLRRLSENDLRELFGRCLGTSPAAEFPPMTERLQLKPLEGFVKGFIDLVFRFEDRFYLVDWKSNFLGDRLEDYAQPALHKVMTQSLYQLQYHLYLVAVDRYLKARLPGYRYESHFGGVFYIFLRGVDPARGSDCGISRHRPAAAVIEALRENLMGTGAS